MWSGNGQSTCASRATCGFDCSSKRCMVRGACALFALREDCHKMGPNFTNEQPLQTPPTLSFQVCFCWVDNFLPTCFVAISQH